jgi:Mannosyl-glycoprotein endo-beta-N-acetylglucosaminidase
VLSVRRVVAAVCAAGIVSALGVPAAASAATSPTTSTTGTQTGATVLSAATTTTTVPKPTATTTKPPKPKPTTTTSSTTSTTSTTTTVPAPPATGVPKVPVAGPATTQPPKGAPPPPPQPSATPILAAVNQDLAQVQAMNDYPLAQQQVAQAQQEVATAGAAVQAARQRFIDAEYVQAVQRGNLQDANAKLRDLAVAAYIGIGFASPDAGPQAQGGQAPGIVSSPGGLTGLPAADANEMMTLVGQKARSNLAHAKQQVTLAARDLKGASAAYTAARIDASRAEATLLSSQQTLKAVTEAATTPGVAATMSLPTFTTTAADNASASAPATTTTTTTTVAPGATTTSTVAPGPAPQSPDILGQPVLTGADLAAWFASTGRKANTTVPMSALAQDYQAAGQATGVRYDLAFAQSVIETGYFSFPSYGQLTSQDNNFAGIGACDTCSHGWSFPTAADGVGAQLELLDAYASVKPVDTHLLGHGSIGVGGCCQTWMALAGVWASSTVYGISIMTVYNRMLTWYIPGELAKLGLVNPSAAPAKAPSPAPLPGGTKTPPGKNKASPSTTVPSKVSAALHRTGG